MSLPNSSCKDTSNLNILTQVIIINLNYIFPISRFQRFEVSIYDGDIICGKVFKNGPSKICGSQPLLGPFLNILFQMLQNTGNNYMKIRKNIRKK